MAPPAERPPSEQGPEYQALDAITDLTRRVEELAQRPAIVLPAHSNWWDVLPSLDEGYSGRGPSWPEIANVGASYQFFLSGRRPDINLAFRATWFADRLELSLQLNSGWILWQRALFFERPAA